MGVRGLTRFCQQKETKTSVEHSDLYDVTLAVDFVGFLYYLCDELYRQIDASPTWLLLGGCTLRLERYVEDWLKKLRDRKVKLLFVTDPPQCFGGESHRKGYCLQDRAEQKAEQIGQLAQSLEKTITHTESATSELLSSAPSPQKIQVAKTLLQTNGRFPFAREKLRGVLKKHGIEIKTASREADEELGELLLDNEFGMADMLAFPVQRKQGSLFPLTAARWVSEHMSILDNPFLSEIEARKKGFLRALFEIYRFYGHSAAFLKKFPMKIEPIIPTKKLKQYKTLIEQFEYPPMSIDVLEAK
eukprot:jgi/Phyca11/19756/fgenesh1_pg.PHYCAscaffold_52_\